MEMKRILVVDDERTVLENFREILELKGYRVDIAETGQEAIEKSEANPYNLALLDIRLPDMEGTELLRRMKDTIPKMVKIMVTGYPSLENAKDALNRGADGYVVKPVNMDELMNLIREHLRKQEEEKKYSEERVKEYIEVRARELRARSSEGRSKD